MMEQKKKLFTIGRCGIFSLFMAVAVLFCTLCGARAEGSLNYSSFVQNLDYGDATYVVGHKCPDTDSVCAAIAYARLKQALGLPCVPAVAGKINAETQYVLSLYGVETPVLLENAADQHVILVDHSSFTQAVPGTENALIVELIDHHGCVGLRASDPLMMKVLPLGSTCTVIYTSFVEYGVEIDPQTAALMTAAILSDTNNLTVATTTDFDRQVVSVLAETAGIADTDGYYNQFRPLLGAYSDMTDKEIFYSDYKEYEIEGHTYGIACVLASEGQDALDMAERMTLVLADISDEQNVTDLYVMVQDEANDRTLLLYSGETAEFIMNAAFTREGDLFALYPVASRKKNVVPPMEDAYSMYELLFETKQEETAPVSQGN